MWDPHLICIHVLNSFNQLLLDKKINQPERRSLDFHEFPGFIEKPHCILIHHWGGWSLPLCPSYPWSMSPGILVGGSFPFCGGEVWCVSRVRFDHLDSTSPIVPHVISGSTLRSQSHCSPIHVAHTCSKGTCGMTRFNCTFLSNKTPPKSR